MKPLPAPEPYERTDADARPVFVYGLVLLLVLGVSMLASTWISRSMTADVRGEDGVSPLGTLRAPPEGPGLQALPALELARHRAWERGLLSETAWIDPLNEIVRIPIERAIELSLAEGFPVRAEASK